MRFDSQGMMFDLNFLLTDSFKMDNTRSFLATNCRSGKRGLFVSVVILGLTIGSALLAYTAFAPMTYHHRLRQVAIVSSYLNMYSCKTVFRRDGSRKLPESIWCFRKIINFLLHKKNFYYFCFDINKVEFFFADISSRRQNADGNVQK